MSRLKEDIRYYKLNQLENIDEYSKEVILECTKELKEKNFKKNSLQIKDRITSFSLLNSNSQIIHIKDIIDKNKYTILNFFQGAWSPYCNKELKEFEKIQKELKILNTKVVSISPQTPDYCRFTKDQNKLSFELLSDKNSTVAKSFRISFNLCEKLKSIYESLGIDLIQFNKNNTFELPLAAIYIINSNYEIIFSFVEEDYTKRCESKDILRAIKKDIINSH